MHYAAINDNDKVLSLLLEAGANKDQLDRQDEDGANLSASCFAAEFG